MKLWLRRDRLNRAAEIQGVEPETLLQRAISHLFPGTPIEVEVAEKDQAPEDDGPNFHVGQARLTLPTDTRGLCIQCGGPCYHSDPVPEGFHLLCLDCARAMALEETLKESL